MTYSVSETASPVSGKKNESTASSGELSESGLRSQLSCLLEGSSSQKREQMRTEAIQRLGLQDMESVPLFDEATQTVVRSLNIPICILSLIDTDTQILKSATGLSSLGLMNDLAAARQISRNESFCTHVVDSGQALALENVAMHPAFSQSLLVQRYNICAYLGVPLFTQEGTCIGTIAVMDLSARKFTAQEIAFLEMSARWCMSEFGQQRSSKGNIGEYSSQDGASAAHPLLSRINQVRSDLLLQLAQDLRNPLTSITGMANMLSREIYGPLSEKQQEYTKIVLDSAQHLLSMVDEIAALTGVQKDYELKLATVDIEMVGHRAISALENLAKQQELNIKLTVEPSSRLWTLDKQIVQQLLYHLVFSIIKMSTAGSTIRLHVSKKEDKVSIALWVSNPWLGEDLPQAVIDWDKKATFTKVSSVEPSSHALQSSETVLTALATAQRVDTARQELGLLLSRYLTEVHKGEAFVQGSAANGYRYIINLPTLELS